MIGKALCMVKGFGIKPMMLLTGKKLYQHMQHSGTGSVVFCGSISWAEYKVNSACREGLPAIETVLWCAAFLQLSHSRRDIQSPVP